MMSIAFGASPPRNGVPRAVSSASTIVNASSIFEGASAMAASLKSSARAIKRRQIGNATAIGARRHDYVAGRIEILGAGGLGVADHGFDSRRVYPERAEHVALR